MGLLLGTALGLTRPAEAQTKITPLTDEKDALKTERDSAGVHTVLFENLGHSTGLGFLYRDDTQYIFGFDTLNQVSFGPFVTDSLFNSEANGGRSLKDIEKGRQKIERHFKNNIIINGPKEINASVKAERQEVQNHIIKTAESYAGGHADPMDKNGVYFVRAVFKDAGSTALESVQNLDQLVAQADTQSAALDIDDTRQLLQQDPVGMNAKLKGMLVVFETEAPKGKVSHVGFIKGVAKDGMTVEWAVPGPGTIQNHFILASEYKNVTHVIDGVSMVDPSLTPYMPWLGIDFKGNVHMLNDTKNNTGTGNSFGAPSNVKIGGYKPKDP